MKRAAKILLLTMTLEETASYWVLSGNTFRKLIQQGYAPGPLDIPGLGRLLTVRKSRKACVVLHERLGRVSNQFTALTRFGNIGEPRCDSL
jgi:hypothetical protein